MRSLKFFAIIFFGLCLLFSPLFSYANESAVPSTQEKKVIKKGSKKPREAH